MAYTLIDPNTMLVAGCRLLGLWGILNSLQWLASADQWRTGTALGWQLQGLRQGRLYGGRWLAGIFGSRATELLGFLQLAASVALCIAPISWFGIAALVGLILASALLVLRSRADGADKMALVVAYGLSLQVLGALTDQPMLGLAGCLWIGGQLALSYATSGTGKLALAGWRNGDVPRKTLSSYHFGHRFCHLVLRNRGVAVALAWSVILIEALFPLALLAPLPVLTGALAAMLLLHLATAVFMGLNTYPIAFAAAFPSALMLARWLHAA